jgi:hypothetical protein
MGSITAPINVHPNVAYVIIPERKVPGPPGVWLKGSDSRRTSERAAGRLANLSDIVIGRFGKVLYEIRFQEFWQPYVIFSHRYPVAPSPSIVLA